ncbi:MAG: hypothetical protein DRN26_05700 [Thermoplasmata archaeon]|nr:MAG: hypothetical protein DRN26_05700 [Thermoplasmata archaeon]
MLEDIGFYTLSDHRALHSSTTSPLWRCEILLTDRCNFKCPYCRGMAEPLRGTLPVSQVEKTLRFWFQDGLKNVRFSGGEPCMHPNLEHFVSLCRNNGVERIALSTNGSFPLERYVQLIKCGVNDFSISLDACCAQIGDRMAGREGAWERVVHNIAALSKMTYVSVGMVFTKENICQAKESVMFAHSLGVTDIRVIPSAQYNQALTDLATLPPAILAQYPILSYRIKNVMRGRHVRGIPPNAHHKCLLMLDDMAVAGDYHFPCIIYLREGGDPVGRVGPHMRKDRAKFIETHNPWEDPICKKMCLDVCIDFNEVASRRKR